MDYVPPYASLSPETQAAAVSSLERLGFKRRAILPDYRVATPRGGNLRVNAVAFADPVRRIPTYAGITVHNAANGLGDDAYIRLLASSTAPFHILHRDHKLSFWATSYSGHENQPIEPIEVVSKFDVRHLDDVLDEFRSDLRPEHIVEVKEGRDHFRHQAFKNVRPLQLSLFLQRVTGPLLTEHFGQAVSILRKSGKGLSETDLLELAVQLLGVAILSDTGVLGDDARGSQKTLAQLFDICSSAYEAYFNRTLFARNSAVAAGAFAALQQISYAGFVPDMLTDLYKAAFKAEERKALGRFDTPLFLTRRIWENIPVELLRPERRTVVDMTCGWGSFLVAGYERLSALIDSESARLRRSIHGNDYDAFTAHLARLGLLLSTSADSWHVDSEDAVTWRWLSENAPDVIVGNPPFMGDRKRLRGASGRRVQHADRFLEHAINRLAPGGYLAVIMPRSFVSAESSSAARRELLDKCEVLEIWELPLEVFPGVMAGTLVIFARKKEKVSGDGNSLVRVRTVQLNTLDRFVQSGVFTASGVAKQSNWSADSRRSVDSTVTHLMGYNLILSDEDWNRIANSTISVPLEERAVVFQGATQGKKRPHADHSDPKVVNWLGRAKSTLIEPFRIDYRRATQITYPNELHWPRLDNEQYFQGAKVLLVSNANLSWGMRVRVAVERRGCYVSDHFWVIALDPKLSKTLTLEVLAAVVGWKVSNAWILEGLRHTKLPSSRIKTIPFPRRLTDADCDAITAAVNVLEGTKPTKEKSEKALQKIDEVLARAYGISDAVLARLTTIYEWDRYDRSGRSLDGEPVELTKGWLTNGVVESVDAEAKVVRLWLDGFEEPQVVPIDARMPGWLLRSEAAFTVRIPRAAARSGRLEADGLLWGRFQPKNFSYLSTDESLDRLTQMFHGEGRTNEQ